VRHELREIEGRSNDDRTVDLRQGAIEDSHPSAGEIPSASWRRKASSAGDFARTETSATASTSRVLGIVSEATAKSVVFGNLRRVS